MNEHTLKQLLARQPQMPPKKLCLAPKRTFDAGLSVEPFVCFRKTHKPRPILKSFWLGQRLSDPVDRIGGKRNMRQAMNDNHYKQQPSTLIQQCVEALSHRRAKASWFDPFRQNRLLPNIRRVKEPSNNVERIMKGTRR